MAKYDPRDQLTFHPSSVPGMQRIALHQVARAEKGATPLELWVTVNKQEVPVSLTRIQFFGAQVYVLHGRIISWKAHPECVGRDYTCECFYWPDKKRNRIPSLTVHNVTPKCAKCSGEMERRDWDFYCMDKDGCRHSQPDPNTPRTQADTRPVCMACGIKMNRAGAFHACPGCGATESAT